MMNGQLVYSDFGSPITVSVAAKADMFNDVWQDEAPSDLKVLDSIQMLLSFPVISASQAYIFNGTVYYDLQNSLTSTGVRVRLNVCSWQRRWLGGGWYGSGWVYSWSSRVSVRAALSAIPLIGLYRTEYVHRVEHLPVDFACVLSGLLINHQLHVGQQPG